MFADDHLKNLSGSIDSPELARSLTYNVYATRRAPLQAAEPARGRAADRRVREGAPGPVRRRDARCRHVHESVLRRQQWFDYNPDTCASFATGCEAPGRTRATRGQVLPDLRAHRRDQPLSLADVNRLAKRSWQRWDDVDAAAPLSRARRTHPLGRGHRRTGTIPGSPNGTCSASIWSRLHYEDLAQWTPEAGIDADRIFTAQGFVGAVRAQPAVRAARGQHRPELRFRRHVARGRETCAGHLGAILYGGRPRTTSRTENGRSLFWNFARMDPGWGDRRAVDRRAEPARARADLRQGVSRVSRCVQLRCAPAARVMAWNGLRGSEAGKPGYRAYTSWRETRRRGGDEGLRRLACEHSAGRACGRSDRHGSPATTDGRRKADRCGRNRRGW